MARGSRLVIRFDLQSYSILPASLLQIGDLIFFCDIYTTDSWKLLIFSNTEAFGSGIWFGVDMLLRRQQRSRGSIPSLRRNCYARDILEAVFWATVIWLKCRWEQMYGENCLSYLLRSRSSPLPTALCRAHHLFGKMASMSYVQYTNTPDESRVCCAWTYSDHSGCRLGISIGHSDTSFCHQKAVRSHSTSVELCITSTWPCSDHGGFGLSILKRTLM
jgi:hypothetical protein